MSGRVGGCAFQVEEWYVEEVEGEQVRLRMAVA